ncbi:MAG TPA: DsrE/DsrF/DrsH-like family protein [Thermoplasmata archaeon]|nr:DsrE/DsrF/DrsH-like family protein [Thermoplasmata archaeon]
MAIVLTESVADKLLPFATLVSGALALGFRVDVFASYWGLVAFRKTPAPSAATVSPGHGEEGARLERALAAPKAPSWKAMLEMAKSIGELHIYACSQSMELLGLSKEELDPLVDGVTGVATFIDRTRYANVTYFI